MWVAPYWVPSRIYFWKHNAYFLYKQIKRKEDTWYEWRPDNMKNKYKIVGWLYSTHVNPLMPVDYKETAGSECCWNSTGQLGWGVFHQRKLMGKYSRALPWIPTLQRPDIFVVYYHGVQWWFCTCDGGPFLEVGKYATRTSNEQRQKQACSWNVSVLSCMVDTHMMIWNQGKGGWKITEKAQRFVAGF